MKVSARCTGSLKSGPLWVLVALACALTAFHAPPAWSEQEASASELMDDLMWDRGPIGGPFTLTDHTGKRRSLTDFRGRLVLLYFGYMHCPDVCPTDLQEISGAIDALGAEGTHIQPLFLSVDPERDTPPALASYVSSFHPRLVGLTGSVEEISSVARSYKTSFKKVKDPRATLYVMDHTAFIYLLDAEGRYLGFFPPGTGRERILEIVRPHLRSLGGRQ